MKSEYDEFLGLTPKESHCFKIHIKFNTLTFNITPYKPSIGFYNTFQLALQ